MLDLFRNPPNWLRLAFIFPILCLNGFLLAWLLNYLQPLTTFLIIATICAFLLELAIQLLVKQGMRRGFAIATVIFFTLFLVSLLGFILIPLMVDQLAQLIDNAPEWIKEADTQFKNLYESPLLKRFAIDVDFLVAKGTEQISRILETFGQKILDIFVGTITTVFNALIIFIFTIFLLIGGEKFWAGIFSWLPNPWNERVAQYTLKTFKDFFFARLILSGISSVVRVIIFIPLGVPYALLFAVSIGLGGIVPFLGGVITLGGTILFLFKDAILALKFFIAAFIIDQVTDNVVAPRLMGEAIGLNPIWLIIALFLGGKIGGILGLLLAVPVASIIKQIIDDLRESPTLLRRSPPPLATENPTPEDPITDLGYDQQQD